MLLMKAFKKLFVLSVFALQSIGMKADDGIVVLLKDGTQVGFVFSERPNVVCGSELEFVASGRAVSYAIDDVRRIYRSDEVVSTGVDAVMSAVGQGVVFRVVNGSVEVSGIAKGERVVLYMVDGTQVARAVSDTEGGCLTFAIPQGKGVCVVKASSGISCKIMCK